MKFAEKHIFDQSAECLGYASLGDISVRIIALRNLVDTYGFNFKVLPQRNQDYYPLWKVAFGDCVIHSLDDLKGTEFEHAMMHSPTRLDWHFGSAAFNVFESVYWENGFFQTTNLEIDFMNLIKCRHDSNKVLIYPNEKTDGNVIFDSAFWLNVCETLRRKKYKVVILGDARHAPLRDFYERCPAAEIIEPTVTNLIDAIKCASLAIGSSTGPTWTCLLSDIKQIVLESKRSPHGYWFFDRCKNVLKKNIRILSTLESELL